jgi:hypothetical protein
MPVSSGSHYRVHAQSIMVAVFALAWLALDGLVIPPDFGHTDIYYFKDAGINFAEGLGLTTRFTYGNPTFLYKDFATYPPIYPLAFGIYAKFCGVSAVSNQFFNALIAVILGLLGYWTLRPLISVSAIGMGKRQLTLLAVFSIATGFYMPAYDRPDGMGVIFGMAALGLAMRGTRSRTAIAAGALWALTLFTSPFAGIWTVLALTIGVMAATPGLAPKQWLTRLLCVGLGAGGTTLMMLGALRIALPGWFEGFWGVASGSHTHNETGGGYFIALLHGDWRLWRSGFAYSSLGSFVPLLRISSVLAALAVVILMNIRSSAGPGRTWSLLLLVLVSPLCLITSPYQSHYPAITAALLIASWAGIEAATASKATRSAAMAILAVFAFNVLLSASLETQRALIRFNAHESMKRAVAFLVSHRNLFERSGRYTAVSPINYILWRQAGLHPLINIYSGLNVPEDRARVDFFALAYPGSGDLLHPQAVEWMNSEEYAVLFQPALPQQATLLKSQISRSSQTWESAIYARRERGRLSSEFDELQRK